MRGRLYCSRKPLSVPLVCTAPWARAACAQAASGPREAWPGLNRVSPSRFWPGHAQSGRCAWLRLAPLARGVALAYSQIKPYYWEIMPRPCHCRRVSALPKNRCFKPNGIPLHELEEVVLSLDGLEALRLADFEDLNMDAAAARMGVSRHTFGRLLRRARRSVAQALVQGQALRIEGGVCAVDATAGGAESEDAMPGGLVVAGRMLRPTRILADVSSIPLPGWRTARLGRSTFSPIPCIRAGIAPGQYRPCCVLVLALCLRAAWACGPCGLCRRLV